MHTLNAYTSDANKKTYYMISSETYFSVRPNRSENKILIF